MENAVEKLMDLSFFYVLNMVSPCMGLMINAIFYRKNPMKGARWSTLFIWGGLCLSVFYLVIAVVTKNQASLWGLTLNGLSLTMNMLIFFVSAIVHQFSRRYLSGDRTYHRYFLSLSAITITASIMVCADNLLVLWAAWTASNLLLISLMVHKKTWQAAKNSGELALKSLSLGSLSLLAAFIFLYKESGSLSIDFINNQSMIGQSPWLMAILLLITITAFIQSAQWPFHAWLTSSLNSPTPVSALMHAGLVNGGGFILVKFSPLFISAPLMLTVIFTVGVITAIVGTSWKLLQTDIKRMLACSTMAQMGFMMMQCGLGLFPAAIAHLCWHGLFKSFLFLNAGSAVQSKRIVSQKSTHDLSSLLWACLAGTLGAYCFAIVSEKTIFTLQPTTFLVGFSFISGAQLAYTLLQRGNRMKRLIPTFIMVAGAGVFYGESIYFIESLLPAFSAKELPSLSLFNIAVFVLFFMLWLGMCLNMIGRLEKTTIWAKIYMSLLNGSQPHPSTITTSRKSYQS
jgi:NAD(P)H-quinone oxidoreductase subunit 5